MGALRNNASTGKSFLDVTPSGGEHYSSRVEQGHADKRVVATYAECAAIARAEGHEELARRIEERMNE